MGKEAIVFGPWAGEFGWELARWIPACRHIASNHSGKKYAIGPRGHGILYEFVDEYIPFDRDFKYVPLMFTVKDGKLGLRKYQEKAESLGRVIKPTLVRAQQRFKTIGKVYQGTMVDNIKAMTSKPIICVFPRQRAHDAYRNWSTDKWVQAIKLLCEAGNAVFAFGGPEDKALQYHHNNFYDLIEYNEEDELDMCISALNMARAGVAIQSGGFYVSLYSCRHTIIFGIERYIKRVRQENITNSSYDYVKCKNFSFSPAFVVNRVNKSIKLMGRRNRVPH
jgi:ADP-heptose:LPS heptosyltransferase